MALNYRISELQAAAALGQLEKLEECVASRQRTAAAMTELLDGIDGIEVPMIADGATHVYWKYCLTVDDSKNRGRLGRHGQHAERENIFSGPRYSSTAFMCQVFQEKNTLGDSSSIQTSARDGAIDYEMETTRDRKALHDVLVLPWNEKYRRTRALHRRQCAHRCGKAKI